MSNRKSIGTIPWIDLTVPNATGVANFYKEVAGWTTSEVKMGGYSDYCVHPSPDLPPVAGICHALGNNADIPPQWLIYIDVADLDLSLTRCVEQGGTIVVPARSMGGYGRFAVIRDPAGAVAALVQPPDQESEPEDDLDSEDD